MDIIFFFSVHSWMVVHTEYLFILLTVLVYNYRPGIEMKMAGSFLGRLEITDHRIEQYMVVYVESETRLLPHAHTQLMNWGMACSATSAKLTMTHDTG
jgi:hypothetical protein